MIKTTYASFALTILTAILIQKFGGNLETTVEHNKVSDDGFWFIMIVMAPIFEELLFRGPLVVVVRMTARFEYVLAATVILSATFGYVHGGVSHIFVQGITGLMFSGLFLKAGGLHHRPLKGLLASFSAHALFNLTAWVFIVTTNT